MMVYYHLLACNTSAEPFKCPGIPIQSGHGVCPDCSFAVCTLSDKTTATHTLLLLFKKLNPGVDFSVCKRGG